MTRRGDENLYLFSMQVGDIVKQPLRKTSADSTIQQAAQEMAKHRVASCSFINPAFLTRLSALSRTVI